MIEKDFSREMVINSAAAIMDVMSVFEDLGLDVPATHLFLALDLACAKLAIDPEMIEAAVSCRLH